jgi:hypothetical protein
MRAPALGLLEPTPFLLSCRPKLKVSHGEKPGPTTQQKPTATKPSFRVSHFRDDQPPLTDFGKVSSVDIDTTGNRPQKPVILDMNCNRNTMHQ